MKRIFLSAALLVSGFVSSQFDIMYEYIDQVNLTRAQQDSVAASGKCVLITDVEVPPTLLWYKYVTDLLLDNDVSHLYGDSKSIDSAAVHMLSNHNLSISAPDSTSNDLGVTMKFWNIEIVDASYYIVFALNKYSDGSVLDIHIIEEEVIEKEEEKVYEED